MGVFFPFFIKVGDCDIEVSELPCGGQRAPNSCRESAVRILPLSGEQPNNDPIILTLDCEQCLLVC